MPKITTLILLLWLPLGFTGVILHKVTNKSPIRVADVLALTVLGLVAVVGTLIEATIGDNKCVANCE